MFCIKCGKVLDPSAKICPDCGTKVILPEGFEPDNGAGNIDVDMLIGEKTVSADHSALARKAAAAANAQSAPAPSFSVPAPTPAAEPAVPHSPAGFDLDKAKKIMNGRSILIDDSPVPLSSPLGTSQAAPVANKKQEPASAGKKTKLIIIIAAIVEVIAVIGAILAVALSGRDDVSEKEKPSETAVETTAEESTTKAIASIGKFSASLIEQGTEAGESTTEEQQNNPTHSVPSTVRPERPTASNTDEGKTTVKEEPTLSNILPPATSSGSVNPENPEVSVADNETDKDSDNQPVSSENSDGGEKSAEQEDSD